MKQHSRIVRIGGLTIAALLAFSALTASSASADDKTRKKLENMNRVAMEAYDLLDFDGAKDTLNKALVLAKRNKMDKDPVVAQTHVYLGIVYFSGFEDRESAELQFINALSIDPKASIDPAYRSEEMQNLFDSVHADVVGTSGGSKGGDTGGGSSEPEVDCSQVAGMQHEIVDNAEAGKSRRVQALVGADVDASRVSLFYRPQGASSFEEVPMTKSGDCVYRGDVPGEAVKGEFLHYYVAAMGDGDSVLASKGSKGSPNIMEISSLGGGGSVGSGGDAFDTENPLGNRGGGRRNGDVVGGATPSGGAKFFVSVAVGTGGGYVSGNTEQKNNEVGCCFAPALLHVFPEIGYYLSPQTSISGAFRMGFPIGANLTGHATAAPSGMLRLRHALDPSGDGVQVSGSLGGGVIRHTVKLTNPDPTDGGDTDTTASGPLFLGGGAGYVMPLGGGSLKFVAELNMIAGLPVISEIGTCDDPTAGGCTRFNFALQLDVNFGFVFAF